MPDIHGLASWPGVVSVLSCSYTTSHGITPGPVMLVTLPQDTPPALQGNLVLTDGVGTTITIPDCKVDRLDCRRDGSGTTWTLAILDRRWRWRETAVVTGYYNQPDPNGIFYPWTVRTPQALCALCLIAMGEVGFDVSLVPNTFFPPVNWDYTNAAQALSQLAEQLGCRVIYDLQADRVIVMPLGVGLAALPDGSIYAETPGIGVPARPDQIVLVGAPIRFQARFVLEAVGLDWDGFYRPLNNLSYRPKQGWETCGPASFAGIEATNRLTKLEAIALAQKSVFKCYRLVNRDPNGKGEVLNLPGYGKIVRREQILLESSKCEQIQPEPKDNAIIDADGDFLVKHFYDGFKRDVPAECYGAHCLGRGVNVKPNKDVDQHQNSKPLKKIHIPFTIDPVWQIVTFSDYIYRNGPGGPAQKDGRLGAKCEDAFPILETACQVRNPITNHIERYTRTFTFPPPYLGTKPAVIYHDDCQYNVIGEYTTQETGTLATHALKGVKTASALGFLLQDTIARSTYYLTAAALKYQLTGGVHRIYNGLVPVWLDGKVQQVGWHIGEPDGVYTQVGFNTEYAIAVPPYPQRLRHEYAQASLFHPAKENNPVQPPVPDNVAAAAAIGILGAGVL